MNRGIDTTIRSLREYLKKADSIFFEQMNGQSSYENPDMVIEYYIEKTFTELLILLESLGLSNTYKIVKELYETAKSNERGLSDSKMGQYDPYLIWPERIEDFIDAISNYHNVESDKSAEPTRLKEVLNHALYSITDVDVFGRPPNDEKELHLRLEAILRCIYPDIIHEPTLTKPIKKFRPDSGIPSIRTLIEYKFISNKNEAKLIADQILADRAAYKTKDWKAFLFVIYETERIKHETEWRQFIQESDVSSNTHVVVLSGVPKARKRIKSGKRRRKETLQQGAPAGAAMRHG